MCHDLSFSQSQSLRTMMYLLSVADLSSARAISLKASSFSSASLLIARKTRIDTMITKPAIAGVALMTSAIVSSIWCHLLSTLPLAHHKLLRSVLPSLIHNWSKKHGYYSENDKQACHTRHFKNQNGNACQHNQGHCSDYKQHPLHLPRSEEH